MNVIDCPTIDESMSCAANSSDLTLRPERRGDADVLIAAGLSQLRLGGALMRLHSEHDAASRGRVASLADFAPARADREQRQVAAAQAHAHNVSEAALLLDRLKSLPAVRAALTHQLTVWGVQEPQAVCVAVLRWWLQPTCHRCGGTKWEVVPGTGRHSGRACKSCDGTGETRLPAGQVGRRLANYMDDCVSRSKAAIRHRLRQAHTGA